MSLEETRTVCAWIIERHDERTANDWLWNCTPVPCGLPTEEQLEEGLRLAAGEVTLGELIAESERRMTQAMAEVE